jgi:hypothetical protein
MKMLKISQKIILILVFILGITLTVLLARQQQDIRQRASQTDLSAIGVCSSNNTIDINVSFTNTSAATINVIARDTKTGKELALGTVTPGSTIIGSIQTELQSLDQNVVTFETSAGETKTATYSQLDCTNTIRSCEVKEAQCTWDALDNTTQYKVTIIDTDTGAIVQSGVVNHPATSFTFPAEPAKKYTCEVTPVNSCGDGDTASAEGTCPVPTPTTVPSSTPSSPTDTTSPTAQPSTTVPTATPNPAPTSTPTQQPTSTPIPTTVITGSTPVPTSVAAVNRPTPTSIKKLPSTGFSQDIVVITAIGSTIAVMGAFIIIFLW